MHSNLDLSGVSAALHCVLFLGCFQLEASTDALFFIGNQLVALSHTGKVGVWNAMTQTWQVRITGYSYDVILDVFLACVGVFQVQDVSGISSYDTAGSFLILGSVNGSISYIGQSRDVDDVTCKQ